MVINFILNGEDVVINSEADIRLIDILRENFSLFGAKSGCLAGQCGACSVIYNGLVSPACLIPAFRIRGSEIITIEGFSQTSEYNEIVEGFKACHVGNCGYCEAGKILCAEAILEKNLSPAREEILLGFSGIKCRCTNVDRLVKSILLIADTRRRRIYGN